MLEIYSTTPSLGKRVGDESHMIKSHNFQNDYVIQFKQDFISDQR